MSVSGSPLPWGFTLPNQWIKCFRVTTPMGFHFSLTSEMSSINFHFLVYHFFFFFFNLPFIIKYLNLNPISNCPIVPCHNCLSSLSILLLIINPSFLKFFCYNINFVCICPYYITWFCSTTSFLFIIIDLLLSYSLCFVCVLCVVWNLLIVIR